MREWQQAPTGWALPNARPLLPNFVAASWGMPKPYHPLYFSHKIVGVFILYNRKRLC
jgi:hypothetical protein